MTKQELASTIWSSANELRGGIKASDYKDFVIGFMFYKYLSEHETKTLKENFYYTDEQIKNMGIDIEKNDKKTAETCIKRLGYYIPHCYLFSTWIEEIKNDKDNKNEDNSNEEEERETFTDASVTSAFTSFNKFIPGIPGPGDKNVQNAHKDLFSGIFDNISARLGELGSTGTDRTNILAGLIEIINDIPTESNQDYDVLGFVYEYLLGNFAADSVKKAGDFYTPHEVSVLMSEIVASNIKQKDKIEIYDPACGSGSLLLNIGKAISKRLGKSAKNNIVYYAQDSEIDPYNLVRMNLIMAQVLPSNINVRKANTLGQDWPFNTEENTTKTVDAVVENPPYSHKWGRPKHKDDDSRFADYGLAPKTKADYAFLLHGLYHLDQDGVMAIVLPHGVLFRGRDEEEIRTALVESNNIDTIIGLPTRIFYATGIPTIIMILKKSAKKTNDILFIDASKGFVKSKSGSNKQMNKLRECDIQKVVDTVNERKTIDHYSRVVSLDEIRANNYNLNIPRYVDSSEPPEKWDLYSLMFGGIPTDEINDLDSYFKVFPKIKDKIFKLENQHVASLIVSNPIEIIDNDDDVKHFKATIKETMEDYESNLVNDLINKEKLNALDINKEEKKFGEIVLNLTEKIPLLDKYQAFQIYSDAWKEIATDIENIQKDGFGAVREIEEYTEKGKKKEHLRGRVLPFEIVEKEFFSDKLDEIANQEQIISLSEDKQQEIFESLDEETRDSIADKDNPEKIDIDEVKRKIKELDQDDEEEKEIYLSLQTILVCEKAKKDSKQLVDGYKANKIKHEGLKEKLTSDVMKFITTIDDESAYVCLREKWITPLINSLNTLADSIVQNLVSKISYLSKKYSETLESVSDEIEKVENDLSIQIDDLAADEYDQKALNELKDLLKGK